MANELIDRRVRERIVIVGMVLPGHSLEDGAVSLDELARLIDTAGADEVARVLQQRDRPDPATYLGKGKVGELLDVCEKYDADTVVFDDELSPAQQRNLEQVLGRSVIDRTAVILDIFAQNAHTPEGKVQVELALLRYRLPRLRGRGRNLSQQAGGIGTRGPGETKLEVDRRRVTTRVARLENLLDQLTRTRQTQARARRRGDKRVVALVGYTNAGKSTLLNRLTNADVVVDDRLFSTLDPRVRRLRLPGGETVLCSDTVGFVRKLPHQLIEAFKSTLEIVREADLLVHVVDSTAVAVDTEITAVTKVLNEIGAGDIPQLVAVNKADVFPLEATRIAERYPGSVILSAATGEGVRELLMAITYRLHARDRMAMTASPGGA
ncbi:MAG: GTPase HflX [Actinobacteria bacterium]|jgi:GTP-binding protein HflX|nr:GTPase HflX [Actinomycetota bacterium]MCL6095256.1 GTPase HflX [Actinomycetota bacterium]